MLLAYPLTAGLLLLRIAIAVRNGMTGLIEKPTL